MEGRRIHFKRLANGRNIVACCMLRPYAHIVACCVACCWEMLRVVAQRLKPVKL